MTNETPNSYLDPYWQKLGEAAGARAGLPAGFMTDIVTKGERSNHDQTNKEGTFSPFQVTKATRDLFLKNQGIDAFLSPENAAEVAARVAKDGFNFASKKSDDPTERRKLAAGYYIAGGDARNWGPTTAAYQARVMGEDAPAQTKSQAPEQVRRSKAEIDMLRQGAASFSSWMKENTGNAGASNLPKPEPSSVTPEALQSFAQFAEEFSTPKPKAPEPERSIVQKVTDVVTGNDRKTAESTALQTQNGDWAAMPELNSFSMASFKTALGTLATGPEETAKILQANYPNVQIRKDDKGNFIFKSSIDGKDYPYGAGVAASDIPRGVAQALAYVPAGRAASIGGAVVKSALTQAGIEASQAATGGEFNPTDVALAGAMGGAVPVVGRVAAAVKNAVMPTVQKAIIDLVKNTVGKVRGVTPESVAQTEAMAASSAGKQTPNPVFQEVPRAAEPPIVTPAPLRAAEPPLTLQAAEPPIVTRAPLRTGEQVTTPPVAAAQAVEPLAVQELGDVAKKAAGGNKNASNVLAEQVALDPKKVQAAERLGVRENTDAGALTSNENFRQLDAAVKSDKSSKLAVSERENLTELGQKAQSIIENLGGSRDVAALSTNVKAEARAVIDSMKSKAKAIYNEVDSAIGDLKDASTTNIRRYLDDRIEKLGGAANLTPAEKTIAKTLENTPQTPYALLNETRVNLNANKYGKATEAFSTQGNDVVQDGLINALRADQAQNIANVSPELLSRWNVAQGLVGARKGMEKDLKSIFGRELDKSLAGSGSASIDGAIKAMSKGDTAAFIKLLKVIPDSMKQEVVATGLQTLFKNAAQGGNFNFTTYAKWYQGLLENKQAHAAIFTNLPPQARKQLSDLYRVSQGVSDSLRARTATGLHGSITKNLEAADGLIANLFDTAKRAGIKGVLYEAASSSIGMHGVGLASVASSAMTQGKKPAMKALDDLLVSAEFKQALTVVGSEPRKAGAILKSSAAFKRFAKAAGNPRELSDPEKWAQSLQQMQKESGSPEAKKKA